MGRELAQRLEGDPATGPADDMAGETSGLKRLEGDYGPGERWSRRRSKQIEARLQRSTTLAKYDITIKPQKDDRQGD